MKNLLLSAFLFLSLLIVPSSLMAQHPLAPIFEARGFDLANIALPGEDGGASPSELKKDDFTSLVSFPLFPEGPSYRLSDNSLFFAGNNALSRVDADGNMTVLMEKPSAGGTHFLPDGSVLLIGHMGLRRVYPDGRIALLADGEEIGAGNDVTMGIYREVYFTVPSKGIYRLTPGPEGKLEKVIEKGANGLDVDPAGEYLYVVRTAVERYKINGPNQPLGEVEVLHPFEKGNGGGDGCTFDAAGRLYSMHFKTGTIRVFDPKAGGIVAEIPVGVVPATNLTFGGPDNRTFFVTAGAPKFENCQVLKAETNITGFCGHVGDTEYPMLKWLEETVDAKAFAGE